MLITFIQDIKKESQLEDMMATQLVVIKKLLDSNRIVGDHSALRFSNHERLDLRFLVADYVVNNGDNSHVIVTDHPIVERGFKDVQILCKYLGSDPKFTHIGTNVLFDVISKRLLKPRQNGKTVDFITVIGELIGGFKACMITPEAKCVVYQ